ncbi:MAG: 50S ribosomal protein L30 [Candidatus Latescibacteria bacterium]|nr:50S ribosomal protein L30 [Candidatus Latescibacterota bacterium]
MKLAIVQCRSAIGKSRGQQETVRALGIRHLHQPVVHEDSPQIRGMIRKVSHLLQVRQIESSEEVRGAPCV